MAGRHPHQHDGPASCRDGRDGGSTLERVLDLCSRCRTHWICNAGILACKLRCANIDAAAGAVQEVARIVAQIRQRCGRVRILLRADSCLPRLHRMCASRLISPAAIG
jgi:hypothetical protein